MCTIGCTARLVEIIRTYEDGRMDIVIAGGRRYRLLNIEERPESCIHASIEYFDDVPDPELNENLFDQCVQLYNRVSRCSKARVS